MNPDNPSFRTDEEMLRMKQYRCQKKRIEELEDALGKIVLLMEGSPKIAPYTDDMILKYARLILTKKDQP